MNTYKNFDGPVQSGSWLVHLAVGNALLILARSKSGSTQVPQLVH